MALDVARLLHWREPPLRHAYSAADTMRYALGVGLGAAAEGAAEAADGSGLCDPQLLRHVHEAQLQALPTLATVLAARFGWLYRTDTGVTAAQCVHAGQALRLHAPLPAAGEVVGTLAVTGIDDKGPGRGALVHFRRELRDAHRGMLLCTLDASMFCRADGHAVATHGAVPVVRAPLPARAPDAVIDTPTFGQQALLFRLCGDFNPIHADPVLARAAGFERPLLHGLSTYGAVAHALLRAFAAGDVRRFGAIEVRFSKPVYPGERLRTAAWSDGGGRVRFRTTVPQRGVTVLDQGFAEFVLPS